MSGIDVWHIELPGIRGEDRPVARAATREILSEYAGCAPGELRFGKEPRGKPTLEHPPARLQFNLSHTHGLGLLAVAPGDRRVGVDVEAIRRRDRFPALARRYFTEEEAAQVHDLERFLAVWTRKEAFVKAVGDGLLRPLDSFVVTVDGPAGLVRGEAGWTLVDVPVRPGFLAALAYEGEDGEIRQRPFRPAGARAGGG